MSTLDVPAKLSLYGLVAEFATPDALLEATRRARQAGYRYIEAYTPFPVEGLTEALGFHRTSLPLVVLLGGIVGGLSGYLLQYWINVMHYPLNVGGRPLHSWPAFIPVTFELTILAAALPHVRAVGTLHPLVCTHPETGHKCLYLGRRRNAYIPGLPLDDSGLVVETIQRDPLLAVLPAGHRLARRARVRVGDLGTEPVILFPRRMAPEYYDLFISTFRRAGCTPRVAHEVVTIQTIIGLVAAGLGVSLMPATIRSLRRDGVVYRPLTPPVPHADMALAYVRDHSSPVLPAFIRTVREVTRGKRP